MQDNDRNSKRLQMGRTNLMRRLRGSGLLRHISLFALVLQLTLVAGHIHDTGQTFRTTTTVEASAILLASLDDTGPPASHDEGHGDTCPFCWAMSAAGTAVSALVAFLASPDFGPVTKTGLHNEIQAGLFNAAAFYARGPPAQHLI